MADDSGDFGQLPPRVQRAIDAAFDAANGRVRSARREAARPSPRKRRRLDDASITAPGGFMADAPPIGGGFIVDDAPTGGGFLPDDASASAGAGGGGFINDLPPGGGFINDALSGGFVVDADEDAPIATHTHIALERIPGALQALDLSPDDADVLAIFHNAASGWGAGGPGHGTGGVARKDWRAVCAVLLAGRPEETFPEVAASDDEPESGNNDDGEDGDDGDEYMGTEEESDSELSPLPSEYEDEDYGASATARGAGKKAAKSKKSKGAGQAAAPSDLDGPVRLTARQQRESRATFALFFPDVPDERLDAQRIRIRDVSRVADLLKEKITAEEIIEMLTEFSTAPDKSMGLADFEQVLVLAQLV